MRKIVLNIPHSSINGLFDDKIGGWPRNADFINECINYLTDWYTDFLFNTSKPNVKSVIFPYSRFVCDVERLDNDPLESIGQGIVYKNYNGYVRKDVDVVSLMQIRENHLNKLIEDIQENDVIIDCHSFSRDKHKCDICIGFNDDWSFNENIVNIIKSEFETSGYGVAINEPFSNSITPRSEVKYKSVMIEVNKKVYMNEKTLKLNTDPKQWMRWFGCLERIYDKINNS